MIAPTSAIRGLGGLLSVIVIVVPGPPDSAAGGGGELVPVVAGRGDVVKVTDADTLMGALAAAQPGQTIELADGAYPGKFVINRAGQDGAPITLRGGRGAVLDGGPPTPGYALHLQGADHWQLVGFTVTGAEKGVMAERTYHTLLDGLDVGNTGAEAVHFLNFSSDNVIQASHIHDTGKTKPEFGEGVYFGTAKSNWAKKSGRQPDRSNNNKALYNTFASTTAENIDVKEETSGGVIAGNRFDGSAISGRNFADSVLDMKGTNYQVSGNTTSGASPHLVDGFQTHVITSPDTSGCHNTFTDNRFDGVTFQGGKEISLDKKCDQTTDATAAPESQGE